jgi:hypothetical protein
MFVEIYGLWPGQTPCSWGYESSHYDARVSLITSLRSKNGVNSPHLESIESGGDVQVIQTIFVLGVGSKRTCSTHAQSLFSNRVEVANQ